MGVVDDNPTEENLKRLETREYRYLGGLEEYMRQSIEDDTRFVIGIGTPNARHSVRAKIQDAGYRLATIVHPQSIKGSEVVLEEGVIVTAGVVLSTNIIVRENTVLNLLVTVGHDTIVGRDCVINPTVNISGDVVIGDATLIGTGAQVLQNLQIGEEAVIGASACVTKDVPARTTAVGIPAKPLGQK